MQTKKSVIFHFTSLGRNAETWTRTTRTRRGNKKETHLTKFIEVSKVGVNSRERKSFFSTFPPSFCSHFLCRTNRWKGTSDIFFILFFLPQNVIHEFMKHVESCFLVLFLTFTSCYSCALLATRCMRSWIAMNNTWNCSPVFYRVLTLVLQMMMVIFSCWSHTSNTHLSFNSYSIARHMTFFIFDKQEGVDIWSQRWWW